MDGEVGGVREDLRDEAVGELDGGAGDLRRLPQQQRRLRQRIHVLRLRRCGCVAVAASSVLPATSSVLVVLPSQPPSFRQKSLNRPSPYPVVPFRQFAHADPVDPHAAAAGEDMVWCVPLLVKIAAARIQIVSTPLHCRGMGDGAVLRLSSEAELPQFPRVAFWESVFATNNIGFGWWVFLKEFATCFPFCPRARSTEYVAYQEFATCFPFCPRARSTEYAAYQSTGRSSGNERKRRPTTSDNNPFLSYYGGPTHECPFCGAFFWFQERVKSASAVTQWRIVYNLCCKGGRIRLEPYKKPPEPLRTLLRFDGDARSKRFLHQI
ncbi:AT hook motif-containing protein [Zea mays]|uniref:AT hook motif-containing protein n=1 Tax=Zea mays TaxID=4577 RepID=A0A1D6P561_MAIZE|nr:AT hook motif-containing protein [Zea mays]